MSKLEILVVLVGAALACSQEILPGPESSISQKRGKYFASEDVSTTTQRDDLEFICPKAYGLFEYLEDCHKYVVCVDGEPTVHSCNEGQVYEENTGCVNGIDCPSRQKDGRDICTRPDELLSHETDCKKYIKCVNSVPSVKKCVQGKAFDSTKRQCTREQFRTCRSNDVSPIMRSQSV